MAVIPIEAVRSRRIPRDLWHGGLILGALAACALIAAIERLPAGATAARLGLVAAVGATLVAAVRREAARADLERALAREANHRIKNDLQLAADLAMFGSDEAASRIRSIATVHRLLTESEDVVDAAALVRSITAGSPVPVTLRVLATRFDAVTAQRIGLVVNELVTNAYRHGAPPIVVDLGRGRLRVDNDGRVGDAGEGLGLALVRRIVEHGLGGTFELRARYGGGTRAEVTFPE